MKRGVAALSLWGLALAQGSHRVAITHPGGSYNQEVAFLYPWVYFFSFLVFLVVAGALATWSSSSGRGQLRKGSLPRSTGTTASRWSGP